VTATQCARCNTPLDPGALSCPGCGTLTHAARLQELSVEARSAAQAGEFLRSRDLWREVLALLPEDTVQYRGVSERIADLEARLAHPQDEKESWAKRLGKFSPLAPVVWLLTKGKLLLVGLTKLSTIATMLLSFGVYWSVWGWMFAAGFVLSIYVHEMGHVVALRQFGIAATAPMFIPGFGALIWQKQAAKNVHQDAVVGLAGPIWGTGAALFALAVYFATHSAVWGAIARTGAWINLFNLTPVWFLDGSHGFRALAKMDRAMVCAAALALWAVTGVPMLVLVGALAGFRIFTGDAPERGEREILFKFLGLLAILSVVARIQV
jgi:Zn-dependent protease/uncharacterized Zn finger protein (UPF0148 family)